MNEPDVIVVSAVRRETGVASAGNTLALSVPGRVRQFKYTKAISRSSAASIPGCAFAFRQRSRSPTAINAGTHIDALCMHYNDFADLVKPTVGTFAKPLLD